MAKKKITWDTRKKRTTLSLSKDYEVDIHVDGITLYCIKLKTKKTLGYFNSLKQALKYIVKNELKEHDKDKIVFEDYIKRIEEISVEVLEIINRLNDNYEKQIVEELK